MAQTGDPTATGGGGENIYDTGNGGDGRLDGAWAKLLGREVGEKTVLGDELHGRLRFNRRGLLGMAKSEDGGYGSQFFVTLGDVRGELDGKCTMFGRVEGEGIYNVVKIAEGELAGERPIFPERILRVEVTAMPDGEAWQGVTKRDRVERRVMEVREMKKGKVVSGGKKKARRGLLSFGSEEGEEGEDSVVKPRKAKFNTALIANDDADGEETTASKIEPTAKTNGGRPPKPQTDEPPPTKRRKASVSPSRREALLASMTSRLQSPLKVTTTATSPSFPSHERQRKPSFHDPTTQLPLRNEETPSRSISPDHLPASKAKSSLAAEIAALKASMRRDTGPAPTTKKKLSALEAMIPASSTRGRKRPRPGEQGQREDRSALEALNAFQARLDSVRDGDADADAKADVAKGSSSAAVESRRLNTPKVASSPSGPNSPQPPTTTAPPAAEGEPEEDGQETPLCDLHFIAHCQSCSAWDTDLHVDSDQEDTDWMSHRLAFGRDTLGKDLNFKKRQAALEELVVIDPREKAGQILAMERERLRARKEERRGKGR